MILTCKHKCCKMFVVIFASWIYHYSLIFHVHIQEKVLKGEKEISPAKITGLMERQIIVCIGAKKCLLYCSDELIGQLEDMIPATGMVEFVNDTLVSFNTSP